MLLKAIKVVQRLRCRQDWPWNDERKQPLLVRRKLGTNLQRENTHLFAFGLCPYVPLTLPRNLRSSSNSWSGQGTVDMPAIFAFHDSIHDLHGLVQLLWLSWQSHDSHLATPSPRSRQPSLEGNLVWLCIASRDLRVNPTLKKELVFRLIGVDCWSDGYATNWYLFYRHITNTIQILRNFTHVDKVCINIIMSCFVLKFFSNNYSTVINWNGKHT